MTNPHLKTPPADGLRAEVFASDLDDLLAAYSRVSAEAACFYRRGPDGSEILGIGAAQLAQPSGRSLDVADSFSSRFEALKTQLESVEGARSKLEILGWTAFSPSLPGAPPDRPSSALPDWHTFSRRVLYVPQVLVRRRSGVSEAVVLAPGSQIEGIWKRWQRVLSGDDRATSDLATCACAPFDVSWLDCDRFREGVRQVTDEHVAPKVVLARRALVHASAPIAPGPVLRNLASAYPSCSIFAVSPSVDAPYPVFVGATPESLARVDNGTVATMALAGTALAGTAPACAKASSAGPHGDRQAAENASDNALLSSKKDLDEQKFVLDMIVDALEPLCTSVAADPEPRLQRLANVSHLMTRISGTLGDGLGLADVVDALHPTPAVCGTPRKLARRLIEEMEGFDRGLYAGAFGWMDLDGNGEFDVALRCGLIDDADALLFAGAGITQASDVDVELVETRSKFEPLLDALSEVSS